MSEQPNTGGPAFPQTPIDGHPEWEHGNEGLPIRDWFAGTMQEDDRLVKCIRAMDDAALEVFALHPGLEREEHITEVKLTDYHLLPSEVAKVVRRLEIEARAIARVRYMQADAMLAERERRVE